MNDLFEKTELPQDASLLPLARPAKPLGSGVAQSLSQSNKKTR